LILLKSVGVNVVLCHGGGPQISQSMKAMGKEPCFVDGLRVTDAETMDIVAMVLLGRMNARLVAMINSHGAHAVGLCGADGCLIQVEPENQKLGMVGRITEVAPNLLRALLAQGFMPVISPIGMDGRGNLYNINADLVPAHIAAALGAEKLVILTNVAGLYESFGKDETLISDTTSRKIREMLDTKAVSAGMIPKLKAVLLALEGGVSRTHILDGRDRHALLLEVFTSQGIGTSITNGDDNGR
jgi:acetylglutamate kinase